MARLTTVVCFDARLELGAKVEVENKQAMAAFKAQQAKEAREHQKRREKAELRQREAVKAEHRRALVRKLTGGLCCRRAKQSDADRKRPDATDDSKRANHSSTRLHTAAAKSVCAAPPSRVCSIRHHRSAPSLTLSSSSCTSHSFKKRTAASRTPGHPKRLPRAMSSPGLNDGTRPASTSDALHWLSY